MIREFEIFLKEFREEAARRNLLNGERVKVEDWLKVLTGEYHTFYDIWTDWQRVFEKVLAIYDILKFRIGESRVITLPTFIKFLEKTDESHLTSEIWYGCVGDATIELLLDSFQSCLTYFEADEIEPYPPEMYKISAKAE